METSEKYEILKVVLLDCVIVLWLHWMWTRTKIYRYGLSFPVFNGFPIIGSLHRIKNLNNIISGFGNILKDSKCHTICFWMGLFPFILTEDPELISNVLWSEELLNKAETIYYPIRSVFKGGIIASKANEWTHNRKMINPAFAHKVLISFFPIFNKAKDDVIEKFGNLVDNREHKLMNMIQGVTLTLTAETTMGNEMYKGNRISTDLIDHYCALMEYSTAHIYLSFLKLGFLIHLFGTFKKAKQYTYQFVEELIQRKTIKSITAEYKSEDSIPNNKDLSGEFAKLKDNTSDNEDIIEVLSIQKEPKIFIDQAIKLYEQQQFTLNDIISESNTIVGAAFETTANAIFSALVLLAMHSEIQQRLFEEILDVFLEKKFYAEREKLDQLPYLDRVINESLRIAPSVPLYARHVIKDTQVGEDVFPKDTQIFIT